MSGLNSSLAQADLEEPLGTELFTQLTEMLTMEQQLQPSYTRAILEATRARKRWEVSEEYTDLCSWIVHYRAALEFCPAGHAERSGVLSNLSFALGRRIELTADIADINERIDRSREAVSLCPEPHPARALLLSNLSVSLRSRFDHSSLSQRGGNADRAESMDYQREAWSLRSIVLAKRVLIASIPDAYRLRYQQAGKITDLEKCIQRDRETLSLRPNGHPDRGPALSNLSSALLWRCRKTPDHNIADLTECIALVREATAYTLSPLAARNNTAQVWIHTARVHHPASV